jgi:AraC-like DNA-binding protein
MNGREQPEQGAQATVLEQCGVRLHLFPPAPELAPFITVYYRTEVPGSGAIEDWLPPEWANLRAGNGAVYEAAIGGESLRRVPECILSGPTSKVTQLRIGGTYDSWGVGLLPLGLAKFFGVRADTLADRFEDLSALPGMGTFDDLLKGLMANPGDVEGNVAKLDATFIAFLDRPVPQSDTISAIHHALLSEDGYTVGNLARELAISPRTLERLCARYFGFTPQLLLRRQRFLRSLAKFMVDPSMKWIASLDNQYHDQAHFLRDFKRFIGMRPSEYGAMNHPIAMTAARARSEALGVAMQILHGPVAEQGRA